MLIYVVLERDWLLFIGLKLKITTRPSTVQKAFFSAASVIGSNVSLILLEAVVFSLAEAATFSTTTRSCNYVDFAANTGGKIIVAFFYFIFYGILFFIFTGAPDWHKYDHTTPFRRFLWMTWDGIVRFVLMTAGVWTESNLRSYNIVPRAERYSGGKSSAEISKNLSLSTHEMTMQLISQSRTVIWIPLPLCTLITKTSEGLNKAPVFVYPGTTRLYMKRSFLVRLLTWLSSIVQLPLIVSLVFSAESALVAALSCSLLPAAFLSYASDVQIVFSKINTNIGLSSTTTTNNSALPSAVTDNKEFQAVTTSANNEMNEKTGINVQELQQYSQYY